MPIVNITCDGMLKIVHTHLIVYLVGDLNASITEVLWQHLIPNYNLSFSQMSFPFHLNRVFN